MSTFKPLALAALFALAFASTAAIAADSPGLGKPISKADIKAWDIFILPDGTNLPPGSGTAAQGAKLFVDKGCNQCHGDNGKGGHSNMLVGSPSLTEPGISANKTIANFWGQPIDAVRLHPPRHAMADAAHAQRRRSLRALRLPSRRQQAHRRKRRDGCEDLGDGEDAEPRQLHHQVPGSDLTQSSSPANCGGGAARSARMGALGSLEASRIAQVLHALRKPAPSTAQVGGPPPPLRRGGKRKFIT